jgi:acyl-coenzyme A synthetase/AMP-(fatty) acid ligase
MCAANGLAIAYTGRSKALSFFIKECVSAGEPLNAEVIKIWKRAQGSN